MRAYLLIEVHQDGYLSSLPCTSDFTSFTAVPIVMRYAWLTSSRLDNDLVAVKSSIVVQSNLCALLILFPLKTEVEAHEESENNKKITQERVRWIAQLARVI